MRSPTLRALGMVAFLSLLLAPVACDDAIDTPTAGPVEENQDGSEIGEGGGGDRPSHAPLESPDQDHSAGEKTTGTEDRGQIVFPEPPLAEGHGLDEEKGEVQGYEGEAGQEVGRRDGGEETVPEEKGGSGPRQDPGRAERRREDEIVAQRPGGGVASPGEEIGGGRNHPEVDGGDGEEGEQRADGEDPFPGGPQDPDDDHRGQGCQEQSGGLAGQGDRASLDELSHLSGSFPACRLKISAAGSRFPAERHEVDAPVRVLPVQVEIFEVESSSAGGPGGPSGFAPSPVSGRPPEGQEPGERIEQIDPEGGTADPRPLDLFNPGSSAQPRDFDPGKNFFQFTPQAADAEFPAVLGVERRLERP